LPEDVHPVDATRFVLYAMPHGLSAWTSESPTEL
jgi:hypothetical protein